MRRILLATLLFVSIFCLGGYLGRITYEPKVIIETQYIDRPVERIVEVPQELRQFQSVEELQEWLDSTNFTSGGDCDDWAYGFRDLAWQDGYDIETEIVGYHMLCKTLIGNEIYYIEPQTHIYWLECYTDL